MESMILSESAIGEVSLCGRCNNIHLSCGNFSTVFSLEGFQELQKMVTEAGRSLPLKMELKAKPPKEKCYQNN